MHQLGLGLEDYPELGALLKETELNTTNIEAFGIPKPEDIIPWLTCKIIYFLFD